MKKASTKHIEALIVRLESIAAASTPAPASIRAARHAAGITQTAAAGMIHTTCRVWQQWEAGDRRMHPAFWELFTIKVEKGDI